jgi:hypothetical protein
MVGWVAPVDDRRGVRHRCRRASRGGLDGWLVGPRRRRTRWAESVILAAGSMRSSLAPVDAGRGGPHGGVDVLLTVGSMIGLLAPVDDGWMQWAASARRSDSLCGLDGRLVSSRQRMSGLVGAVSVDAGYNERHWAVDVLLAAGSRGGALATFDAGRGARHRCVDGLLAVGSMMGSFAPVDAGDAGHGRRHRCVDVLVAAGSMVGSRAAPVDADRGWSAK